MKKQKEKHLNKFQLWKQKMKQTEKGRAYLKLFYWAIFFGFVFVLLFLSSLLSSGEQVPVESENQEDVKENSLEIDLEALQESLLQSTYDYQYEVTLPTSYYLFDGTKSAEEEEGYRTIRSSSTESITHYYIDLTGVYELQGEERLLLADFYQEIDPNFLQISYLFEVMNELGLERDLSIDAAGFVYSASDEVNRYYLNLGLQGDQIQSIEVQSIDGTATYHLSFSNIKGSSL